MKYTPLNMDRVDVLAILAGRKTELRILIQGEDMWVIDNWHEPVYSGIFTGYIGQVGCFKEPCPLGMKGDLIWVREPWRVDSRHDNRPAKTLAKTYCWYEADNRPVDNPPGWAGKYRHALHMPRQLSRILLEVESVTVQRVQDVTEEQAEAEGSNRGILRPYGQNDWQLELNNHSDYKTGFQYNWYRKHGKTSWDQNDWCWVVKFKTNLENVKNKPFAIFGSHDSQDLDVIFWVDRSKMGKPNEMGDLCKAWGASFAALYQSRKEVNPNLAVVEDGVVVECYKGTPEELNNSLLDTYGNHLQHYPLPITRRLERDVLLKVLRTYRVILSLLSRTNYREVCKLALRGSLELRITTLDSIDLTTVYDLGTKNENMVDFRKTIAFQLGQTLALMYGGLELYTKKDIIAQFPQFGPALLRQDCGNDIIQSGMRLLTHKTRTHFKDIDLENTFEPKK